MGIGLCVLAAPEIVVGAVIVMGVVVVGFAIKEALDAYSPGLDESESVRSLPETRPMPEPKPPSSGEPAKRGPEPEPKTPESPHLTPIETSERERRRKCVPIPGPPRGGNDLHNKCASNIPNNTFPGSEVFVNGKNFDALQLATRTLWEVKTDDFEKHSRRTQQFFVEVKLPEMQRERKLAEACGYDFAVGVRGEAHKAALKRADPTLKVFVMDWC